MVYVRTQDLNNQNIPEKYRAIREWADANGIQLEAIGYDRLPYNQWADFYFWTGFKVTEARRPNNGYLFDEFPCPECQQPIQAGTGVCPNCVHIASCNGCNVFGLTLYTETAGDQRGYCWKCSKACARCEGRIPATSRYEMCSRCDERTACRGCNQTFSLVATTERNGARYCPDCITHFCDKCGTFDRNRVQMKLGDETFHYCKPCAEAIYDAEREKLEAWDIEEMPVSGTLMIPSSKTRPTRTISIETEFDGQHGEVTRALHKAGLLPSPHREERHQAEPAAPAGMTYPCLMKRDGSVSGGELVTFLLDLDNANHAEALLRMTEVMKGCRDMGYAVFSKNAGGHIHIDLHGYNVKDAWAYYTIHMYLQRTLYYLGGAGADYGHRSLQGSGYAPAHTRGPFGDVRTFAAQFPAHRNGLNLGLWWRARTGCQCGAYGAGEFDDCKCNLGKATAEWRVWNAEVTPRILHAWISLMQAVTAFCQGIENFSEKDYPYDRWQTKHLLSTHTSTIKAIKQRLEWIHRELPLTIHERDSIIYAAKRSELAVLGNEYLDGLLNITNNGMGKEKKPAPNPATRRKTQFKLKRLSGSTSLNRGEIEALINEGWEIADRGAV